MLHACPHHRLVAAAVLGAALAACSAGHQAGAFIPAPGDQPPAQDVRESVQPDSTQTLYLASLLDNAVIGFPSTAHGNVAPSVTIAGNKTQLDGPVGLAVDRNSGKIYVANAYGTPKILIFPKNANGNVIPTVLAGSNVPIQGTEGIAVDAGGRLYVSDYLAKAIYVFASGATGNTAPIRTISGTATLLSEPIGMTFDSAGHLYVCNLHDSSEPIEEFAAGAHGNVAPIATIGGSHTGLVGEYNVALDPNDRVIAPGDASIEVFAAGAHGNVAPVATIKGNATQITGAAGVGTNAQGQMYLTNGKVVNSQTVWNVLEFGAQANGNVHPLRSIAGNNTKLDYVRYPVVF